MELNINELTIILESVIRNGDSNVFVDNGIEYKDMFNKIRNEIIKKQ